MDHADLPVISLAGEPGPAAAALGASFRRYGFALVGDHGIDAGLVQQGWGLAAGFFALAEAEKRRCHVAGLAGARGYTPFGTEIAKGASVHDLKEFWHVGRDLPAAHPLAGSMPPNIWPGEPEGFRETFTRLFAEFDRAGARILSRIALHLGLPDSWFDAAIADGNSVLRLLHYPPVDPAEALAIRAGAHEDINLITLLPRAEEAGLELLDRNGEWREIEAPAGTLVVNIGDMLQRLTNHVLPSTTHRVRNPDAGRAGYSRYAMPFFLHPASDFRIATLPGCISTDNPDRFPVPITADDFLQMRLREIGLKK